MTNLSLEQLFRIQKQSFLHLKPDGLFHYPSLLQSIRSTYTTAIGPEAPLNLAIFFFINVVLSFSFRLFFSTEQQQKKKANFVIAILIESTNQISRVKLKRIQSDCMRNELDRQKRKDGEMSVFLSFSYQ